MIKINLVKTKKISGGAAPGVVATETIGLSREIQKQGLLRLFIILLLPIALYFYETQNLPALNSRLQSKRNLLQSLTKKNSQAKTAVEEIKKFKEDQAQLQMQISTLDSLRKERLREVKILDNLQKDIPEKIWISRITLDSSRMLIAGVTVGDAELSTFMDTLSKSVFLKKVNLVRSSDMPFTGGVQTKSFEIVCDLENFAVADGVAPGGTR